MTWVHFRKIFLTKVFKIKRATFELLVSEGHSTSAAPVLQCSERIAASCSKIMLIVQNKRNPSFSWNQKELMVTVLQVGSQPNHKIPFVLNALSAFFLLGQWQTLSLVNSFACRLLAKQWMRFTARLTTETYTHAKCGHKCPKELWITIIACSVVHGTEYNTHARNVLPYFLLIALCAMYECVRRTQHDPI